MEVEVKVLEIQTIQKARKLLLVGLLGAFLTLIGDLLIGYVKFPGGAVHLPCGVFMWLYHTAAEAAGQAVAYELAFHYILYFILPVSMVFYVFFAGSSIVQFVGIVKVHTPLPK